MNTRPKDIESKISEMTDAERDSVLLRLARSEFWPAILKYLDERDAYVSGALKSIDGFKEPTMLARSQGMLLGLADLEGAVEQIINKEKEKNKENSEY